jgi:hypothetical protein
MLQVKVHGGRTPESYHFDTDSELVSWLLSRDSILEVTVHEV